MSGEHEGFAQRVADAERALAARAASADADYRTHVHGAAEGARLLAALLEEVAGELSARSVPATPGRFTVRKDRTGFFTGSWRSFPVAGWDLQYGGNTGYTSLWISSDAQWWSQPYVDRIGGLRRTGNPQPTVIQRQGFGEPLPVLPNRVSIVDGQLSLALTNMRGEPVGSGAVPFGEALAHAVAKLVASA